MKRNVDRVEPMLTGVNQSVSKHRTIGNYRIEKLIAEGGFGRTYLAEQTLLGTKVCIKHAINVSKTDENILLEEAKAIWDLRHFGIPNVKDVIRLDDGSIALVMNYIPGPTLAELITKHKFIEPENVAWITERCINVLKYLHYHGIIHGDVKPANVIIQGDRHSVVLVDYGLSMIRPSKDSTSKGYTPLFASPEQINGTPLLPESDFFGLGMTMISALGGDVERRKVPKETPPPLCEFIHRLTGYDVLNRPNWQKEDLQESFSVVREKSFGRRTSGMKVLPNI